MIALLSILGGVALLLFGVRYLRKGLDRLLGRRLGPWMGRVGSRPGLAFLAGLGTSVVAPSSTTVSLLAVQTVRAGHMTARQMLAVLFGANIGLTMVVQLLALNVTRFAPLLILLGVPLFQFTRSSRSRGIGQVALSLGFILLAVNVITSSVAAADLGSSPDFIAAIELLERHPIVLSALAAVLAIILQSSTATIGLVIGVAAAGVVGLDVAIPAVLGANVGLSVTTLIVGFAGVESRRLALSNLILKSSLAAVILVVLVFVGPLPRPEPGAITFWVAQAHTGFNVLLAIVGLSAISGIVRLAELLVPTPPGETNKAFGPRYIHAGLLGSMSLAMGQAKREILRVSELVRGMLDDVWIAMKNGDEQLARAVSERDDKVDLLDQEIKRFLTRLVKEESDDFNAAEQIRLLRFLSEFETIGDIIDKNISELVLKKIRGRVQISPEVMEELDRFKASVEENLVIGETAVASGDRRLAEQLLRNKERIDKYEAELRDRHFARLTEGDPAVLESSAVLVDLLTHLRRVNSCVTHIAHSILQDTAPVSGHSALE